MRLLLADVWDNDGYTFRFSRSVEPGTVDYRGSEIRFSNPVIVTGYAKNVKGTIEFYATIKGSLETECARCGDDAEMKFSFNYFNTVNTDGGEDGIEPVGMEIDLTDTVIEAILGELPYQVFCKSGCRGLCPKCGTNLNYETCDCTSFESDEVWEKLKNLKLEDD